MWKKYLKKFGILLPNKNTAMAAQLIYLSNHIGEIVAKDDIADFVQKHIKSAKKDQQIRHLGSQKGWYVLNKNQITPNGEFIKSGYHCLVTLEDPLPGWLENKQRRKNNLSSKEFGKIKELYNYQCATCGAKEGENHRKFLNEIVKLQKGHKNPSCGLDKGNIIPQCQICNQAYLNKWIFDENGFVHALYDPNIILKSPEKTQREVYNILKKKFEKS